MAAPDPYFDPTMFGKLLENAMNVADCQSPDRLARLVRSVTDLDVDAQQIDGIIRGTDKCDVALMRAIIDVLDVPGGFAWFAYAFPRPDTHKRVRAIGVDVA